MLNHLTKMDQLLSLALVRLETNFGSPIDERSGLVSRLEQVLGQFRHRSRVALGPFESIKDRSLVQYA